MNIILCIFTVSLINILTDPVIIIIYNIFSNHGLLLQTKIDVRNLFCIRLYFAPSTLKFTSLSYQN